LSPFPLAGVTEAHIAMPDLFFFFFFCGCWDLNSGPHSCIE
jgi:hypothetical protein